MSEEREYESHESYGLLSFGHVSGGHGKLFGSDVRHTHKVRLTICRARCYRSLSNTWYSEEEELIEVEMSMLQFAEAVTRMNVGPGHPCTILRVQGGRMAECPARPEAGFINNEFKQQLRKLVDGFADHLRAVEEILAKKTVTVADRKAIREALDHVRRQLTDSLPFVQKQFGEAMEGTVAQAKAEVEAFLDHAVRSAGQAAIAARMDAPQLLTDESDKE